MKAKLSFSLIALAMSLYVSGTMFVPSQALAIRDCGDVYSNGPTTRIGEFALGAFYAVPGETDANGSRWLCPEKIVKAFEANGTIFVLADGAFYVGKRNWLGTLKKFEPVISTCYTAGLDSARCDDFVSAEVVGNNLNFTVKSGRTGVIDLIQKRIIK